MSRELLELDETIGIVAGAEAMARGFQESDASEVKIPQDAGKREGAQRLLVYAARCWCEVLTFSTMMSWGIAKPGSSDIGRQPITSRSLS